MKITKQKLQKVIKEYDPKLKYPLEDIDEIETLMSELEREITEFFFGVCQHSSGDGQDYWLQAEYHSPKLNKTIIWNYDWPSSFESEDELIKTIQTTLKEIEEFEKNLFSFSGDINDASNPARKIAINIIEGVIEPLLLEFTTGELEIKQMLEEGLEGEKYYETEDKIVEIITGIK